MSKNSVSILDYGSGNLFSVSRVFEYCNADVNIVNNPKQLTNAKRIVVPGVGAFKNCIDGINLLGFNDAILEANEKKIPILGICVGMQILFDYSEEFGNHKGLGIFEGGVKQILSSSQCNKSKIRVPHVGWNSLVKSVENRTWSNSILENLPSRKNWFYFVHSYAAFPLDNKITLADCFYGDNRICSVVQKDNIFATQFHLELSGKAGIRLVENFLKI